MLNNHEYVDEKLRRFQSERLERASSRPSLRAVRERRGIPAFSLLARVVTGIERWAHMSPRPAAVEPRDAGGLPPCADYEPNPPAP